MTREEAISVLNDYDINSERHTPEEVAEAHEMAVEALKTQPSEDCISRDATLTAFSDYVGGGMSMNDFDAMWDIVVKMPPVEPKPKTSEDCISRQAALSMQYGIDDSATLSSRDVVNVDDIEDLPSVTPQQKTGHWVLSGGYWRCSECKEKTLLKLDKATGGYREYEPVRSKYCPKCGAKMQEAKK